MIGGEPGGYYSEGPSEFPLENPENSGYEKHDLVTIPQEKREIISNAIKRWLTSSLHEVKNVIANTNGSEITEITDDEALSYIENLEIDQPTLAYFYELLYDENQLFTPDELRKFKVLVKNPVLKNAFGNIGVIIETLSSEVSNNRITRADMIESFEKSLGTEKFYDIYGKINEQR